MAVCTVLERGPKGKKTVAYAVDWPGWSRGGQTADEALATLEAYRQRYRAVAVAAGMIVEFDAAGPLEVIEDRVGTGSTDFWGISFSPSATERDPMSETEMERKIALLRACWAYFDAVGARVSREMRRGPRGGGRDRDTIISHTVHTEIELFAKRVGLRVAAGRALTPEGLVAFSPEGLVAITPEGRVGFTPDGLVGFREAYVDAMRAYNNGARKRMRSWTLPFLIRHSAFHVMDHAWEMEDKDLSGEAARG